MSNFKKAVMSQQLSPVLVAIDIAEQEVRFNMVFPVGMTWLARWFVDAYNREQPMPKDWDQ